MHRGERLADGIPEIQIEPLFDQGALQSERRAAQSERVPGPRGLAADRENSRQRVEPVGDRNRNSRARRRQLIARCAWQVVLADGRGHFVRLAVRFRVVRTHDALQFGELAHHGGEEIALAQLRRALRLFAGAAGGGSDVGGEFAHAPRLVAE